MRKRYWLVGLILINLGCEKDINIKLDPSENKLVVEASIENGNPPLVILTQSLDYFNKINPVTLQSSFVRNAIVSISNPETGERSEWCNAQGRFGGYIPKDKKLTLRVQIPCDGQMVDVSSREIGPLSGDLNLNDITATYSEGILVNVKIIGCYDNLVKDAYFTINGMPFFVSGTGNYSAPFCKTQLTFTAFGGNPWR